MNTREEGTQTRAFDIIAYPSLQQHTLRLEITKSADPATNTVKATLGKVARCIGPLIRDWAWWKGQLAQEDSVIPIIHVRSASDNVKSPLESSEYVPPSIDINVKILGGQSGKVCEIIQPDPRAAPTAAQSWSFPIREKSKCLVVCFDAIKVNTLVAVAWFFIGKPPASATTAAAASVVKPERTSTTHCKLNLMFLRTNTTHQSHGNGNGGGESFNFNSLTEALGMAANGDVHGKCLSPIIRQAQLSPDFLAQCTILNRGQANGFGQIFTNTSTTNAVVADDDAEEPSPRHAKRKRGDDDEEADSASVLLSTQKRGTDPVLEILEVLATTLLSGLRSQTPTLAAEYQKRLAKMCKLGQSVDGVRQTAVDLINSWQEQLDLKTFVQLNFRECLLSSKQIFTRLIRNAHQMVTPVSQTETEEIFKGIISFAIFIYPCQFWSSHELTVAAFRLLPRRLKALLLELANSAATSDHGAEQALPDPPLAGHSWEGLITGIYLHQLVMPLINATLRHWIGILEEAKTDQQAARLVICYLDLYLSNLQDFGTLFKRELGTLHSVSAQNRANPTLVHSHGIDLENSMPPALDDQRYFETHILAPELLVRMGSRMTNGIDNSGGSSERSHFVVRDLHSASTQRRFAEGKLAQLSGFLPGILLRKPILKAATAAAGKGGSSGNNKGPRSKSLVTKAERLLLHRERDVDLMDIEDLAEDKAPLCIRSVAKRYKDVIQPFTYGDRKLLTYALMMATSRLIDSQGALAPLFYAFGSTPIFSGNGGGSGDGGGGGDGTQRRDRFISNSADRETIAALVYEWYKYNNPIRFAYIQSAQVMDGHDFGPSVKGMVSGFLTKGEITSFMCACTPPSSRSTSAMKGGSNGNSGQLYTPPYDCPYLTAATATAGSARKTAYTPTELQAAATKCRVDMGLPNPALEGSSAATVRTHGRTPQQQQNYTAKIDPPKVWADRSKRAFELKQRMRSDAVRATIAPDQAGSNSTVSAAGPVLAPPAAVDTPM